MANTINIPADFLESMQKLLKDEYDAFIDSYDKERFAGLRINPLKATKDALPFENLKSIPWEEKGYYYNLNDRPGKHPLHEGGAYYIQEPSAMSAVAALDPKPGDIVLDLCAAPGGKSTQIAGRLNGNGLLVSNEIVKDRAKILSQNIERLGIRNAVVTNESPERLSVIFSNFFDKILVDAPCSGEGMFKKEENATLEWSPAHVEMCAKRQEGILEEAAKMLKTGGILCYSTCTFNPLENEGAISTFVNNHPEFTVISSPVSKFFDKGHPEYVNNPCENISYAMRLWPHKINGEGHFVCVLKKQGELTGREYSVKPDAKKKAEIKTFLTKEIKMKDEVASLLLERGRIVTFGENIYLVPNEFPELKSLHIERPGLHIAIDKKNRIEPSHALAMSLRPFEVEEVIELSLDEAAKYLNGESLNKETNLKGWTPVCYRNTTLGFTKISNGILKNHYPKGLRRQVL